MDTLIITGSGLTVNDVVNVARHGQKIELHPDARKRILECRAMLEKKIDAHEIMYGVNTGIGEFSEMVLNDDQIKDFQKYLVYNHAAGIGDPASEEIVRGAMLGRINVHAHGNSGCRLEITETYVEMLNKGVTPFACQKGSVGACGDLAPMSQIALLLMGEGKAYYKGELLDGAEAMKRAGIKVPGLMARDGLAAINGSNMLTAMSAIWLVDANNWLKQAEIAAAMSLEALKANMKPYAPLLHEARGFKGAIRSANAINMCVSGGDLKEDPTGGNTYLDIEWNFGDGGTGVGSILAHTFVDPGVYDVVVTVKDDDGSSPPPRTLTVEIRADSLSIDAYADLATVAVGDPVTFGVDAEMCDFAGEASDYNRFDFLWQMDDARETEYVRRAPTHVFAAGDVGTREVRVRLRDFPTTTPRWATVNVEVTAAP